MHLYISVIGKFNVLLHGVCQNPLCVFDFRSFVCRIDNLTTPLFRVNKSNQKTERWRSRPQGLKVSRVHNI